MTQLHIEILDNQTQFTPGSPIEGVLSWEFDNPPRSVELRLLWYTSGKGDRDSGIVYRETYENPMASDVQSFSFESPAGPYSFSGKLITLAWAIEVVIQKQKKLFDRVDLVIAPGQTEIQTDQALGQQSIFPDR